MYFKLEYFLIYLIFTQQVNACICVRALEVFARLPFHNVCDNLIVTSNLDALTLIHMAMDSAKLRVFRSKMCSVRIYRLV